MFDFRIRALAFDLDVLRASFRALVALLLALAMTATQAAGAYFEKDGAALRGHDPVAYFTEGRPVRGTPAFRAQHEGSTFLFATAAHRDAFVADPGRYAPQYGGYCAFGMANGYKAATDPAAFTVSGGKLYLNYNAEVQRLWSADMPGFLIKADKHWPTVSTSDKVVD